MPRAASKAGPGAPSVAALAFVMTGLALGSARADETSIELLAAPAFAVAERSKLWLPPFDPEPAERQTIDAGPPAWAIRQREALPVEPIVEPLLPMPRFPPPPERSKHVLLGLLETGLIMGSGTFWYWSDGPRSRTSDMRFDWSSWKGKLDLTAVRFDDDRFETNAASHPTAGMGYYQVARGSGFSYQQSYLWAFASSFLWEYLVEWNEKPSINDIVLTPAAGAVLGEATFRLGRFFAAGEPTIVNRLGALIFSPFAELNDLATGRRQSPGPPYDTFGFTSTMRHTLALSVDRLSCVIAGEPSDQLAFGFETSMVTHSAYRRPGQGTSTARPGEWTELAANVLFNHDAAVVEGVTVHSSTLVVGRYSRRYAPREPGETWRTARPRGQGLLFGLGSAFDYRTRQLEPGLDRMVSVGLLGPTVRLDVDRGWLGARVALSSYYSFAIVQSLALMMNGDPAGGTLTTELHKEGYYYGHGVSSVGSASLRIGDVELGGVAAFAAYWSINGRDRYQETLHGELSTSDQLASGAAVVTYRPGGSPIVVAGRLENIRRTGQIASSAASIGETRAGVGAGLVF
jgi:hypothetical protein